jgi:VWFA-related protein
MVTTMRRLHFWGFIAGGLLLVPGFNSAAGARQSLQEKQIIVTVINTKTGNPVTGVTAPALVIKEDGTEREIVKVEPATSPMAVVLLADTTATFRNNLKELRDAAAGFITAFTAKNAGSSVALWKFGGAVLPVTQFVTDAGALNSEAAKLRPQDAVLEDATGRAASRTADEAASVLLDAVVEGSKALAKRSETRKVVVSFNKITAEEKSRAQKPQVVSELQKSGAAWFGVTLADGGTASSMRDSLMAEVTRTSGGLRLTVQEATRLDAAMKALADMLSTQYVVTYKRASGSAKEVAIEVKGEGLGAFYSRWAPK